jgi:hypothetical protein
LDGRAFNAAGVEGVRKCVRYRRASAPWVMSSGAGSVLVNGDGRNGGSLRWGTEMSGGGVGTVIVVVVGELADINGMEVGSFLV